MGENLLAVSVLAAVWAVFVVTAVGRGRKLIESVLAATTIFGVLIVLITQLLSSMTAFTVLQLQPGYSAVKEFSVYLSPLEVNAAMYAIERR